MYELKSTEELGVITMKNNKTGMRNFTIIDPSTRKSKLQKYRGVIFHDTEELCKC